MVQVMARSRAHRSSPPGRPPEDQPLPTGRRFLLRLFVVLVWLATAVAIVLLIVINSAVFEQAPNGGAGWSVLAAVPLVVFAASATGVAGSVRKGRPLRTARGQIVVGWLALVVAAGIWAPAYQTHWPSPVLDRELARIGPPLTGAKPADSPHTFGGNILCFDTCLSRGRGYHPARAVPLAAALAQADHILRAKGYSNPDTTDTQCSEYPAFSEAAARGYRYQLQCNFFDHFEHGRYTAWIDLLRYSPTKLLSWDSDYGSREMPVSDVPTNILLRPDDRITVEVGYH